MRDKGDMVYFISIRGEMYNNIDIHIGNVDGNTYSFYEYGNFSWGVNKNYGTSPEYLDKSNLASWIEFYDFKMKRDDLGRYYL